MKCLIIDDDEFNPVYVASLLGNEAQCGAGLQRQGGCSELRRCTGEQCSL